MKSPTDQFFYGHGKLLISGEYFVLSGAKSLALPSTLGQSLSVRYQRSEEPKLNWRSFDSTEKCWFEADFELWRFEGLTENKGAEFKTLQKILRHVRKLNPHFLREEKSIYVETRIEFPLGWGLGSSSTLLYNIAQWAYVSPFELAKNTLGGSGYDIACAQSYKPIFYQNIDNSPEWEEIDFNPEFSDKLYFLYLNKKKKTGADLKKYLNHPALKNVELLKEISEIANSMASVDHLSSFQALMNHHEQLVSQSLDIPTVRDLYFNGFSGAIKSLGAWGGDFCLVASDQPEAELKEYFSQKGFKTLIKYHDLVKVPKTNLRQNWESSFVQASFQQ